MAKKIRYYIDNHTLLALIVCLVFIRLMVVFVYGNITLAPDSENYMALGKLIAALDFKNYSGGRTPGFPLLIALSGQDLYITIALQIILGILGSLIFYDFLRLSLKSAVFAFWTVLITNSFVHFIFFEFAVLTESLTVFLMILTFWYIKKYKLLEPGTHIRHYFIISLLLSWLFLTRPQFLFISLGLAIFILLKHCPFKQDNRYFPIRPFIVVSVAFICFLSICYLNKRNSGYFTVSTYSGIYLSQIATPFFEKAPEKDKLIRDIVVKHRDSVKKGEPRDTEMSVWFAQEELREKTELKEQDLNKKLGHISKELFREHPFLYSSQVFKSFVSFWGYQGSFEINSEKFAYPFFKKITLLLWRVQRYLLIFLNVLFLMFSFKKGIEFFKNKLRVYDFDLFLIVIVLSGALSQALVVSGLNSRFAFPFFPLIVYFVLSNLIPLKFQKR